MVIRTRRRLGRGVYPVISSSGVALSRLGNSLAVTREDESRNSAAPQRRRWGRSPTGRLTTQLAPATTRTCDDRAGNRSDALGRPLHGGDRHAVRRRRTCLVISMPASLVAGRCLMRRSGAMDPTLDPQPLTAAVLFQRTPGRVLRDQTDGPGAAEPFALEATGSRGPPQRRSPDPHSTGSNPFGAGSLVVSTATPWRDVPLGAYPLRNFADEWIRSSTGLPCLISHELAKLLDSGGQTKFCLPRLTVLRQTNLREERLG